MFVRTYVGIFMENLYLFTVFFLMKIIAEFRLL